MKPAKISPITETAIAINSFRTNVVELGQKVKSMMTFSENRIDKQKGRARLCKVCGEEGQMTAIRNHIEAKHLTGLSIPCNACNKTFHTRNAMNTHQQKHHSQSNFFIN